MKASARSFYWPLTPINPRILHSSLLRELIVAFNSLLSSSDLDNLKEKERKQHLNTKESSKVKLSWDLKKQQPNCLLMKRKAKKKKNTYWERAASFSSFCFFLCMKESDILQFWKHKTVFVIL